MEVIFLIDFKIPWLDLSKKFRLRFIRSEAIQGRPTVMDECCS